MTTTLPDNIETYFRAVVADSVTLRPEGEHRYLIENPFSFDDGDHLAIVLKLENGAWILSDEGHTLMHLSYSLDESSYRDGTRGKIIENVVSAHGVTDRGGELIVRLNGYPGSPTGAAAGNALYDLIQAILKVSDVTYLSRERVQTTFFEDFRRFIADTVPRDRLVFDWFNSDLDPKGHYKVDAYINGSASPPLAIYALSSDLKARDATIFLLRFEQLGMHLRSVGIFEDQEEIARDVLARFTDVCERQYSNLTENRDRIAKYILSNIG
jgi:hypothetical protein